MNAQPLQQKQRRPAPSCRCTTLSPTSESPQWSQPAAGCGDRRVRASQGCNLGLAYQFRWHAERKMRRPQNASGTAPAYPIRPSLAAPRETKYNLATHTTQVHAALIDMHQQDLSRSSTVDHRSNRREFVALRPRRIRSIQKARREPMPNRRSVLSCAVSVLAGLTACGGDGGSVSVPAPPITTPPPPAVQPPVNLPPRLADTEVRISGNTPFTLGCVTGGGTVYRNSEVEPQVAVNPRRPRQHRGHLAAGSLVYRGSQRHRHRRQHGRRNHVDPGGLSRSRVAAAVMPPTVATTDARPTLG